MRQHFDMDIVVPCYNPPADIVDVLTVRFNELCAAYAAKKFRLIIANDGSIRNFGKEEIENLLKNIPDTIVVHNQKNLGKGAAVRAGIAASDASYTIYTDIDMPYSLASMCDVIDCMFNNTDVVIAVRNGSYYSKLLPLRKVMSRGSQLLNQYVLRIKHTDTQGGLKGLSPKARVVMLQTKVNDFLFDTEFIVLATRQKNLKIVNIETNLREEIVMSKMSMGVLVRESFNFFKIVFRR